MTEYTPTAEELEMVSLIPEEERRRRGIELDAETEYTRQERTALDQIEEQKERIEQSAKGILLKLRRIKEASEVDLFRLRYPWKQTIAGPITDPDKKLRHELYVLYRRYQKLVNRGWGIEAHAWTRTQCLLSWT